MLKYILTPKIREAKFSPSYMVTTSVLIHVNDFVMFCVLILLVNGYLMMFNTSPSQKILLLIDIEYYLYHLLHISNNVC